MMRHDEFCRAESDVTGRLQQWFGVSPGRYLLEQEELCLQRLLPNLFGYYLVQLGPAGICAGLLRTCRIRTRLVVDRMDRGPEGAKMVLADFQRLPIASESVDVVVFSHALDFSVDPHQVLREAERILIGEGRLIILGFNPWSLWGFWKLLFGRSGQVPWCGRFLSQRRLHDWLFLLGFEVEEVESIMFRPPLPQTGMMRRLQFMERLGRRFWPFFAGAYVIHAVKRVSTPTLVGHRWNRQARLLGRRVIEPTTRSPSI